MNRLIGTILNEWLYKKLPEAFDRGVDLKLNSNTKVRNTSVVIGFRRVGKTYVIFNAINKLLETYSKKEVIYNFGRLFENAVYNLFYNKTRIFIIGKIKREGK